MERGLSLEELEAISEERYKSDLQLFDDEAEGVRDPKTKKDRFILSDEKMEEVAEENKLRSVTIDLSKGIQQELPAESDPTKLANIKSRELPPATENEAQLALINYQQVAGELRIHLEKLLKKFVLPTDQANTMEQELATMRDRTRQAAERVKNIHVRMGPEDKTRIIWEHAQAVRQSRDDYRRLIKTYFPGESNQGPNSTNAWSEK